MLQAIRSRAGGIVIKVLFGLLILSFGFWGIYTRSDYYSEKSPETVVAKVGDHEIRADELQKAMQAALERMRQQFGQTLDMAQAKQLGIVDTLLNQLIDRALLDQEAARLNLDVSDDIVRSAIFDNPAFKTPDGRFDRMLFNQVLIMNQLTEDQLVARLRRDIPRSDLLQALTVGVTGPRPVLDTLYRYRNEKRVAEIVAFPLASAPDPGQPSEADLQKFYDAHAELFRAPEFRGLTVLSLSPDDMAKGIEIPEDRLKKEYEERKDEFNTAEQREVEQIMAPSEEKAKEGAAALEAGKDFKEVAKDVVGQDPDTIELGLLKRQEMPRELGDIAFDLPVGKPSDPVKTPLGWHILRVVKIEPGTTQTLEQVKDKLSAEMAREEALDRIDRLANKIDDALAGGTPLPEVADKFGMKLTNVAASDLGGRDAEGKPVMLPVAQSEVLKTAFDLGNGETSRVTASQDGAIYAVHVDKVMPTMVKPLAEVKDQAVTAWQAEQKHAAVLKEAEELAAAVKPDAPLAAVAADKKLTVTTSPPLPRRPEAGSTVSPALAAKLFGAKPSEVVTVEDASGAYVGQLKEIQNADPPAESAASGLQSELAGLIRQDLAGEFTTALRNRFKVEIHRDAIDRIF
jgi:peptidyl-prolyl cis-trans isomerase D